MKYINTATAGEIKVFVDAALFSKNAVLKCLYWYGDKFHTTINLLDDKVYEISLKVLENTHIEEGDCEIYLQKLERDLVDFELKEVINNETRNVRDLLVAKAFSNGEFDEPPFGNATDPVGFNPATII